MLRRTATETGREVLRGVQKAAVARIAAGSSKDKQRKSGGQNGQKPCSYLLELALRAGQK